VGVSAESTEMKSDIKAALQNAAKKHEARAMDG
jgi:hypothetical protein